MQQRSIKNWFRAGKRLIKNTWSSFKTQAIRRISDISNYKFRLKLDLVIDNYTIEAKREYVGYGYDTRGHLVSKVQRLLRERGYNVKENGKWGPCIQNQLKIPNTNHLPKNSIVGSNTMN